MGGLPRRGGRSFSGRLRSWPVAGRWGDPIREGPGEAGLGPGWTCSGLEPAGAYLQDRGDHPAAAAAELAFGLEAAAVSRATQIAEMFQISLCLIITQIFQGCFSNKLY